MCATVHLAACCCRQTVRLKDNLAGVYRGAGGPGRVFQYDLVRRTARGKRLLYCCVMAAGALFVHMWMGHMSSRTRMMLRHGVHDLGPA